MPYTTLLAILDTLDTLTGAELEQVQIKLDSVLANLEEQVREPETEEPRIVEEMVRCGKASCTKCAGGQRGHGPYRYEVRYSARVGHDVKRYVGKKPTA